MVEVEVDESSRSMMMVLIEVIAVFVSCLYRHHQLMSTIVRVISSIITINIIITITTTTTITTTIIIIIIIIILLIIITIITSHSSSSYLSLSLSFSSTISSEIRAWISLIISIRSYSAAPITWTAL